MSELVPKHTLEFKGVPYNKPEDSQADVMIITLHGVPERFHDGQEMELALSTFRLIPQELIDDGTLTVRDISRDVL
jgi:hypothetical protein